MVNVEVFLVDWLNGHSTIVGAGLPVFMDVPDVRPKRFVTVERTGGPDGPARGLPMLALQVWATHRFEAADLALVVAAAVRDSIRVPMVRRVGVLSVTNNPHPDSKQARYQVVVDMITRG